MSGLCGVVAKEKCSEALLIGTDYHSHLGSQLAGMAVQKNGGFEKKIHDISQGQFKSKFEGLLGSLVGNMGIGVISDHDAQPLLIQSRFGTYALAMTGNIENKSELVESRFDHGSIFTESNHGGVNSIELLAKLIETGSDLAEGLGRVWEEIDGAASMLLLTKDGILAARDGMGRWPLAIGERDGNYMIASEPIAFTNLGFKQVKELGPGEIVRVNPDGYEVLRKPGDRMRICTFLWIYTGYPASSYEGIGVEGVRERTGGALAKRDTVEADLASGVPDSGIGHGVGYAMEARIPFRRVLVKYTPGYGRSYIPSSQTVRDHVAMMKLIPVPEVVKGNRIVVCEDSIVRGTQLRNFTVKKLWNTGATEIHMRPACPPLMFPCRYGFSTRGIEELVARMAIRSMEGDISKNLERYVDESTPEYEKMVEWIGERLNVSTLRYQRLSDMIEAVGLPEKHLCTWCWTGQHHCYNPKHA